MTKREIINKWGGFIAALWAEEFLVGVPTISSYSLYYDFFDECRDNGYFDDCAEDLFLRAVTYATRIDYKSMTPLQRVRLQKGLSQTALAEKAVINLRTLQEYEQGRKSLAKASYDTVVSIARALDVAPVSIV